MPDDNTYIVLDKPINSDSVDIQTPDFDVDVDIGNEKEIKNTLAKKFVDLVGQGNKPHEAAKLLGTTMKGIATNESFRKQVTDLVNIYNLPDDLRKVLVRAGLNKIFLENIANPMIDAQKLALEAAKVIGSDPQVGLNALPTPGITININEIGSVLEKAADKEAFIDIKPEKNDN